MIMIDSCGTVYYTAASCVKISIFQNLCVVFFFWSFGIMDCYVVYISKQRLGSCILCCLHLKRQQSFAHALGASLEWHFSFPLMNSSNKTEAATCIFPLANYASLDLSLFSN